MGNNTEKVWVGLFAIFCFIVLIVAFCGCNSPKRLSREAWCEDHAGAPMVSKPFHFIHPVVESKDVTIEHEHIYTEIVYSYADSVNYGIHSSIGWPDDWKPCVCIKCMRINICK